MNTTQLFKTIKILTNDVFKPIEVKVFPCDIALDFIRTMFFKKNTSIHCIAINLDDSQHNGSHWIAFLIDWKMNKVDLFDSLSLQPLYPQHVVNIIGLFRENKFAFTTNYNKRFQSFDSNCCGHYCALYFYHRLVLNHNFDLFCHWLACNFDSFCSRDCAVYESVYKLVKNGSTYVRNNPSERCTCIQRCKEPFYFLNFKYGCITRR